MLKQKNTAIDKQVFAKKALLADGWQDNVLLSLDCNGVIQEIKPQVSLDSDFNGERLNGCLIPGMVNSHSHAFQWAMAGLAERSGQGSDSFWSWRNTMYSFVHNITPDDLRVIASALYMQMLKAGYTSVGEFHYLHHDFLGARYNNPAEMSLQIFEAAKLSGIALTLLPVFYRYSGFGEQAPNKGQARFINNPEEYTTLLDKVADLAKQYEQKFGIAPHSLRAVNHSDINLAIDHLNRLDPQSPIHIHIAEQTKEVQDCLNYYNQRPVEWLMNNFDVENRWCLVHATHMNQQEVANVADSNAVVSICTTTEGNLGDGFFPMMAYKNLKGRWSVGSDSHISINACEELRWLEYQQRLQHQSRTLLTKAEHSSNGLWLWQEAVKGGAQSLAQNSGKLEESYSADWIELDMDSLPLLGKKHDQIIDSFIFNQQLFSNTIKSVWVKGKKWVENNTHIEQQKIEQEFSAVIKRLTSEL